MENKKRIKTILIALAVLVGIMLLASAGKKDAQPPVCDNIAAVQPPPGSNQLTPNDYGSGGIYFRMLFAIFIVAGMGVAVYWIGKRLRYNAAGGKKGRIEILETAYLAARKTLHIVRVGNKTFLIGSTNDSISSIAEVSDSFAEDNL
jgi:hypothetical protein